MLVPLSWLKDYVDIDVDPQEMVEGLTISGSNVEGVTFLGKDIRGVLIGQILQVKDHPNADKLLVTQVDVGGQELQIVTGATNVEAGDKIPVAVSGARLEGNFKIRNTKLRGVKSEGMLCSAQELGMDPHGLPEEVKEGILILPQDAPVGEDLKEYLPLEDMVIDFEITPNRPDCLCILGIAREAGAAFNLDIKKSVPQLKEEAPGNVEELVSVTIEAPDLCSRYIARVVEDIVIEPSPLWMQRRLQAAGVRSINNIVDITNYTMLELGQPLHAFDLDDVTGGSIIVRRAKAGEKITTLDDVSRTLAEDMLVIADEEKAVAIAGVMGGANSEIVESTKRMLLESASFSKASVRKTSRKLGLRSEASQRFERGIDPDLCQLAVDRACELIEALGAGKVVPKSVDKYPGKAKPKRVKFRPQGINKLLGTQIESQEMVNLLSRLEIDAEVGPEGHIATIPSFRPDIELEADLAEEVGRLYGYNKLPSSLPQGDTTIGKLSTAQRAQAAIKEFLAAQGYSEIYTYSFISPKALDKVNVPQDDPLRETATLLNPLGEDHSIMRTTMLPSLLDVIKYNLNQKVERVKIFETAAVYRPKGLPLEELPEEPKRLLIGICGGTSDFYELKMVLENLFHHLHLDKYEFSRYKHFAFHPGRSAKISLGQDGLAYMGEVHPDVLENYDISQRVIVADLDLDLLMEEAFRPVKFKPLPRYPASHRDLALVVGEDIPAGEIMADIGEVGKGLLEDVKLFDIYQGDQIPAGHKSLAFSCIYRSHDGTLTDTQVDDLHQRIKDHLVEKYSASLRE